MISTWTKTSPTTSGLYWHWNGDEDCDPIPLNVAMSRQRDGSERGFVMRGQYGLTQAIDCQDYGGLWMAAQVPPVPEGVQ